MVSARKKASPERALIPLREAVLELRERGADRGARVLVRLRRGRRVDADVLEPALKGASGVAELAADVARLGRDPADHHQEQADAHRDQAEHDENRARGRGIRWLFIHATSGEATAATTAAVITGATIVCVSEASHTRPTRSSATPTRSQDVRPTSRSQRGRGEDAGELTGVDLDVVALGRGRGPRPDLLGAGLAVKPSPDPHPARA